MISSFSSFIVATSDLRCSLLELFVLWCKNRGSSKRDTGSYDIQFDDFSIESLSERDLGVILKQGLHLLRMDLYQRAVALHTGSYDIQFDDFSIESLSERDLGVILKQGLHLLRMDLYQRAVALHIEVQNGGGYRAGG